MIVKRAEAGVRRFDNVAESRRPRGLFRPSTGRLLEAGASGFPFASVLTPSGGIGDGARREETFKTHIDCPEELQNYLLLVSQLPHPWVQAAFTIVLNALGERK